jgi:hypothetical protein
MAKTIPLPGEKLSPKAASKPGKIAVKKATASAIREALGVTRSEAEIGASAIRSVRRASALTKDAASKTVSQKKRTPPRPAATR